MTKLSTGALNPETYSTEAVMRQAYAAFYGINATARAGASPGEGVPLDGGLILEGLCALSAMIIDAMPEVKTNAGRRVMSEVFGARVHAYLKQFRDSHEASGKRAIEAFGSVLTPEKGSMN